MSKPPKWYEDWELSIIGWENGTARIDILLPHSEIKQVSFHTTKEEMRPMANFIDKALSELTGTKGKKLVEGSTAEYGFDTIATSR